VIIIVISVIVSLIILFYIIKKLSKVYIGGRQQRRDTRMNKRIINILDKKIKEKKEIERKNNLKRFYVIKNDIPQWRLSNE
jgi:hypothetical protein